MVDISILEPYLLNFEDKAFNMVRKRCEDYGTDDAFEHHLVFMDCTRWSKDGKFRLMQTIGFPYCKEITEIVWLVTHMLYEEDRDKALERVIEQHKNNIAYEVEHPPIWYTSKKYTKKDYQKIADGDSTKPKRRRKTKEATIDGFGRETVAQRKIKEKVAKLSKLQFKIKPL